MAEGPVEHWLLKIQNMMIKSLYDVTKKAYFAYPQKELERDEWLFDYAAQPVLTVDSIKWTEGCTTAIERMGMGRKTSLSQYSDFMVQLLNREVSIVRGDLNTL